MQPDRGAGGVERVRPLGDQPERDARQHIPRPGGRQIGRSVGVDDGPPIRCRDHRVGTLQKDDRATARRRGTGAGQFAALLRRDIRKDPGEFAFVRGQQTAPVQPVEQVGGRLGEAGQRVGVQHAGLSSTQRGERMAPRVRPDSGSRSQQHRVLARIHQQSLEGRAVRHIGHDQAGRAGGVDRHRVGWAGHRDQPCPGAQSAPRRQPRRAGHPRPAKHHRVPSRVFVRVEPRPGVALPPQVGAVHQGLRRDGVQHRVGNADVGDHHLPAENPAGQQQMAGLAAEEGDGQRRLRGHPHHLAAVAVQAAGHVHGNDGAPRHRLDDVLGHAVERAGQPGPEQRVDDQRVAFQQPGVGGLHRPGPAPGRHRRVSAQRGARPQQGQPHRPARFKKKTRDDEAVATIVARPAQDDGRVRRPALADRAHHRGPRRLHQHRPRHTARHGQRVGAVHLRHGKQFVHRLHPPQSRITVTRHNKHRDGRSIAEHRRNERNGLIGTGIGRKNWGDGWDSNPRPLGPQPRALPTELPPPPGDGMNRPQTPHPPFRSMQRRRELLTRHAHPPSRGTGAMDGTRTHDRSDHNRELYQLSYHRHRGRLFAPRDGAGQALFSTAFINVKKLGEHRPYPIRKGMAARIACSLCTNIVHFALSVGSRVPPTVASARCGPASHAAGSQPLRLARNVLYFGPSAEPWTVPAGVGTSYTRDP
ncbi:protein of unknown function [Azospirillum baldaniorum]|uniref:Uncharacterized protein n=1 Tax=Azospirillum baldaniorum TaxID=1064539 RepID=A0A9P1JQM2_9PROT|nr:protein of unknown function [Azospirillum baldaniorum]